jgi:hypothetical protein
MAPSFLISPATPFKHLGLLAVSYWMGSTWETGYPIMAFFVHRGTRNLRETGFAKSSKFPDATPKAVSNSAHDLTTYPGIDITFVLRISRQ